MRFDTLEPTSAECPLPPSADEVASRLHLGGPATAHELARCFLCHPDQVEVILHGFTCFEAVTGEGESVWRLVPCALNARELPPSSVPEWVWPMIGVAILLMSLAIVGLFLGFCLWVLR